VQVSFLDNKYSIRGLYQYHWTVNEGLDTKPKKMRTIKDQFATLQLIFPILAELKVDDNALVDLPIGAILWLSIKVEMFSLKESCFSIASDVEIRVDNF
jgi:hypothetical protein